MLKLLVHSLLQHVVEGRRSFSSRVDAIEEIATSAGEKASRAWLDALTRDALAPYDGDYPSDAELLAPFACRTDLGNVLEMYVLSP